MTDTGDDRRRPPLPLPPFSRGGVSKGEAVKRGAPSSNSAAIAAVVHAAFFGFLAASQYGVRCVYDAPDEAFMAVELIPGSLTGAAGLVEYAPEYDAVG